MTTEEKLRLYADRVNMMPQDVEYVLGLIGELEAELAATKAKLAFTYCAFCGHEVALDADASLIAEHVLSCEKHPIRELLAQNEALRAQMMVMAGG